MTARLLNLTTWTELNNKLRHATEEQAKQLLETYTAHGGRPIFKLRIYQRYSQMRKEREREELGITGVLKPSDPPKPEPPPKPWRPPKPGRPPHYPFATMRKYDRFTVPSGDKTLRSFRNYCTSRSNALGKKFRCKLVWVESLPHFEVTRIA